MRSMKLMVQLTSERAALLALVVVAVLAVLPGPAAGQQQMMTTGRPTNRMTSGFPTQAPPITRFFRATTLANVGRAQLPITQGPVRNIMTTVQTSPVTPNSTTTETTTASGSSIPRSSPFVWLALSASLAVCLRQLLRL